MSHAGALAKCLSIPQSVERNMWRVGTGWPLACYETSWRPQGPKHKRRCRGARRMTTLWLMCHSDLRYGYTQ